MGNSCAQDCSILSKEKAGEEALDLDSEHASTYPVVNSARQDDLPRLFGSKQALNQEKNAKPSRASLSSGKASPREDLPVIQEPAPGSCISKSSFGVMALPDDGSIAPFSLRSAAEPSDSHRELQAEPPCEPVSELVPGGAEIVQSGTDSADTDVEALKDGARPEPLKEAEVLPERETSPDTELKPAAELKSDSTSYVMADQAIGPSVELVFEANGEMKRVILHRKPLGAEFSKGVMGGPTKVRKVHPKSYATELGIKPGWMIKCVGTEDVSKKSLAQAQTTLNNALIVLPVLPGH
jgi:hypothetical protein